jgi:hypothetical protein
MPRRKTFAGEMLDPGEAEWGPLRELVTSLLDDFMYMFAVDLEDGRRLHAYKHYYTRCYVHLDSEGRAFAYTDSDRYVEINPLFAIDEVLKAHSRLRGPESAGEPWRVVGD